MKTRKCSNILWVSVTVSVCLVVLPVFSRGSDEIINMDRIRAEKLVGQGLAIGDNSEEEAAYYRKAARIDPTYAGAHFNLGFVLQSQGQLSAAIQAYRQCLEYDPTRIAAHQNLADGLITMYRDAALYEVRHHLNLAIELQEALPLNQNINDMDVQKTQLLEIEQRIHEMVQPPIPQKLGYNDIVETLSRPRLRSAKGWYSGPRLPLPFFGSGETHLTSHDEPQLKALAQALNSPRLVDHAFIIEGHADGRGRAWRNMDVSRRRAEAVCRWLIRWGHVLSERLTVEYFGEDHPIFPNDSNRHYDYNRRIEIVRR
jgi:outer membrane protein OmpA-like peptidoglycan-associated protein